MGGRPATIREANAVKAARRREPLAGSAVILLASFSVLAPAQQNAPAVPRAGSPASVAVRVRTASNFAKLPLSFEENRGQTDARVKFLSRGPGYTLFLTNKGAAFAFPSRPGGASGSAQQPVALRLRFNHAYAGVQIAGQDELPGKTNYFPSGNRSTWHTGIPNHSSVAYREIYPGIDAIFHGDPQRLEFDFEVAPGADPAKIALDVDGGRGLRLDGEGNVLLGLGKSGQNEELKLGRPLVYQQIAGARREIPGKFVLRGPHRIGFRLGEFDRARPLVIDPTLSYSTYLGGNSSSDSQNGNAIAVDSSGDAYVTGGVTATDFPTPGGGTGGSGAPQAFVAKFGADGTLLYTSFLQEYITVWGIAVDSSGSAYVGGAADYGVDVTPGAYLGPSGGYTGSNLDVIKLSPDGSTLAYAAQIGAAFPSNENLPGMGIAVDSSGSAYVAASTNLISFPTTTGAYQSSCWSTGCTAEATVTKLSADGSSLVYSTLLGGHGGDSGTGIAVDANGDAFVTGATGSTDFPTTTGVLQPACSSSNSYANQPPQCADTDIFVTELNPTGSSLVYSTYLGNGINLSNGADSQVGIAVDAAGNAYVSASTDSTVFTNGIAADAGPTIMGPPMNCNSGYTVCSTGTYPDYYAGFNFLAKIAPGGGTLAYLGFLGGYSPDAVGEVNGYTWGDSVAVDSAGNAYLTGTTQSSFFPTTSDALLGSFQEDYSYLGTDRFCTTSSCGSEAYFSILNTGVSGNNSLTYSTYLGAATLDENPTYGTGIAVDTNGNAWLTGYTMSSTFPTTPNALQSSCTLASSSPPFCDPYAFVSEFATAATVPAAAITAVSGGGQSTIIGQAFANPLTVNVTDASNNPVSGVTVTFSAPTSGASATPSSTTATTDSSGNASVTATANGIASSTAYTVSATVTGVTTPATFSLTNTEAATTVTVSATGLSLVYGQMVTIIASINPSSVLTTTPTGSVVFYDGATALVPDSAVSAASASYTVNVPTVGTHNYAAQYLGDTNFQASALTSASSAVVVNKASVTLAGPATQPVTVKTGTAGSIQVTIAGQYTGSGIAAPSGGLSYSVSGNAFGPGSLPVANGTATISVPSTLAVGQYTITVSYAGDANYNPASITIQLDVNSQQLVITPATLPTGVVGDVYSQTLSASGGTGTGYQWGVTSGTALSAVGLTLSSSGVISGTPTAAETAAAFTVDVVDSAGDVTTMTYHLTINPALAITTLTLPYAIEYSPYSYTLTATGGSGAGYTWSVTAGAAYLSGWVSLSSAGVLSGTPYSYGGPFSITVQVVDSIGDVASQSYLFAVYPQLSLPPGNNPPAGTVGVPYSSDIFVLGGSGGYTFTILSGAANLTDLGLSFSSAGVISGTPTAAGQANFTVQVTDSTGHTATQSYTLTINNAFNISDPETVTVTDTPTVVTQPIATVVNITGNATYEYGQPESFTATVTTNKGSPVTSGTVSFQTCGNLNENATISLGSAGNAVFNIPSPPAGGYCVVATYNGTAQYLSSENNYNPFEYNVDPAPTTTQVIPSAATSSGGSNTTFTAIVLPADCVPACEYAYTSGTPAGTVTFYDGTTAIGTGTLSAGVATLTTDMLPGGADMITAVYSGGNNYLGLGNNYLGSTSNAVTELVTDFTVTVSAPAGLILWPGQSTTFTFTLAPTNGDYNETVNFAIAGLPPDVTATFNPQAVTLGSSPVTVTVTLTAAPLNVMEHPEQRPGAPLPLLFALLLLPLSGLKGARRRLRRGGWLTLALLLSFIAVTGLGACVSGSGFFNQPPQTYAVTLTAISGADQHSATLNLTVE